ncbi:glycosyltransferase [Nocardioides nematodiphilus]|uniref:glycosyltransferase n=1 Tax=Nocardioides nematodiphilus TaxID=2849669 RepID=UPI001CD9744A|nr:glycosyltransferase [Nocardioides nematodiphilus]MCA1981882.1 glycosyltransferase [Nocardioides nematodiphilus]
MRAWPLIRFTLAWAFALALLGVGLPKAVNVSWHGVVPVLASLHASELIGLTLVWGLGLWVHTFVLTAAAPSLTHRRALTLNVTGSAVSNVVPLGGAAGVALNHQMMRSWGVSGRSFAGFTFLTNLWDVLAKLALPVVGLVVLDNAGEPATFRIRLAALLGLSAFVVVLMLGSTMLLSPRLSVVLGGAVEQLINATLALLRVRRRIAIVEQLLAVRDDCAELVARGWLRMTLGMVAYLALQGVLLWWCLDLSGAGATVPEVLAGFAVERLLTVLPITPGGLGVADVGLAGVLLALGGDPTGVAAGVVLYRVFVFAVEIPVGGGTLGLWLLGRRRAVRRGRPHDARSCGDDGPRRIAHVTDVFLPRLGGIETHVNDLVRHQRARGLDAVVLTPTRGEGPEPDWIQRISILEARKLVADFDVVHVHLSMFSTFGLGVARAAMSQGVPVLLTVHSMWAGLGGIIRLAAHAALRRWPVAWSAVSHAAAETFRRSLGGIDVAVLPNALDVSDWRPATRARDRDDGAFTIVSVMRLTPRKRPLQLLRIFRNACALVPERDVRLVIVGSGPLARRLARRVEWYGLTERIRLTGRIPRDVVLSELSAADLYVAPAAKESFGIAALEARCSGVPVIASRRSGVGEFIRDRVDGLLVDGDGEMAVAIAELITDAQLRGRISAHNRRVRPPFDWPTVLDQTTELYRVAGERVIVPPTPVAGLALA